MLSSLTRLASEFALPPKRLVLGASWGCGLIALQTWQSLAGRDDWPLSSFPMYSAIQQPQISKNELRAVSPAGEVELTAEQVEPLSPRTISMVLRHTEPKHATAIQRAIFEQYYARREAGLHDGPMLSALREYKNTWALRPDLANHDEPKVSMASTIAAFDPQIVRALEQQASGEGAPPPPIAVRKDAIVLELSVATLGGNAEVTSDTFAAKGSAVSFPADRSAATEVQAVPSAYADLAFRAAPGRYYVWLRGKALKRAKRGSVWLQLDAEIATDRTRYDEGLGRFREAYPARAFGWASVSPLDKPAVLELVGEAAHVLRVSGRDGPVVIDQIVLSLDWVENPAQTGPARVGEAL